MEIERLQPGESSILTINSFRLGILSKIWWFVYLTSSVSLISVYIYFLFTVNLSDYWIPAIFILPMAVALGVLAYESITLLTMSLNINGSSIYYRDLLGSKQIAFHDIKGFRVISTAQTSDIGLPGWEVEIESTKGAIITAPKSMENQKLLVEFLRSKFKDLDTDEMKWYLLRNKYN